MYTLEDVIEHCNEKEYVLNAVKEDGGLLEGASDELKNDKEILMTAVETKGWVIC